MRKAFSLNKGERLLVALLVCFGLLQIAGYWFAGAMVNGDGPLAIPQPDAALYLQSAVRVAAGHPFSFSEGAAVSTGSTTVLHPFLFSIPVLLGVKGFALVSVFFWINAALYLLFLFGWCAVIWRHVGDVRVRFFACVLLVLFPQPAYAAMAMSDIGLWLGFSGLFAAALAYDRRWLYGSLLVAAPWIRPEGMVLVIAFVMVMAGVAVFARPKFRRSDAVIAALGVASMSGVFALNYTLVGFCQFSSVLHKGHFVNAPFSVALSCSMNDLLSIARAFFFGQTVSMPRNYYMIPIVGGLMFWIGAFVHDWRGEGCWRKYVLPLAMAGGVWTVATSGWQNTNADRYLAWIMPMVVILMAEGFAFVSGRMRSRTAGMILLAFPLLFAAGTSVAFWSLYNSSAHQSDQIMKFGLELDRILPADASLGSVRLSGIAFPLRTRRIATLTGIYSTEFKSYFMPENYETLKNRPETRFTHWLFAGDDGHSPELVKNQPDVVAVGPQSVSVARADWSMFDRAAAVPTNGVDGLSLRCRMDVGDPEEEALSMYEAVPRYGMRPMPVFSKVAVLGGAAAIESGRVVWGFDEMYVPLDPGKDVTVVMRTLRSVSSQVQGWQGPDYLKNFDFGEIQKLAVGVDGRDACICEYRTVVDGFTDAVLHIPGSAIVNPVSRIAFMGDHIACCYWFFQ